MAFLIISLLIGALAIVGYFITTKRSTRLKARQQGCQPALAYPHLDPVFGLDLKLKDIREALRHSSIPFTAKLFKQYGKTIDVNNFGQSTIRTIDPENIQTAYFINEKDWGYEPLRLPVMEPFCGRGFITTDGPTWKHSRALLRPTFSRANISDMSAFKTSVEHFIGYLPNDTSTIDLQPLLATLFLDTSTQFLLGESLGALAGKDGAGIPEHAKAFLKAFHSSLIGMGLSFIVGPFRFLIPKSMKATAWQQTHQYIDSFIDRTLQDRKQQDEKSQSLEKSSNSRNHSLLKGLAEQTDDRVEIRNQIIQGMMAAQDTTSVLLSNTFFLLSRHPAIYERLRAEVLSLDSLGLQIDTLRDMTLLSNVLRESLRMYPIFPIMVRVAKNETTLPRGGGEKGDHPIYITPGVRIVSNFYALHRVESIFGPDIERFNPDRWDSVTPGPWDYMPFGGGPRGCVGQQKALAEAAYTIARIAQKFKGIESRDDRDWAGEVKLTARNANGCKVALIPVKRELQLAKWVVENKPELTDPC